MGLSFVPPRRFASVSSASDSPNDSNVLRKVASLSLSEQQQQQQKSLKPKHVIPEKLDFKLYEKFEGQVLLNWLLDSFKEGNYLRDLLAPSDMRILAQQFASLLLAAGVLKHIEEEQTSNAFDINFRVSL
jgi:hypothetical protein